MLPRLRRWIILSILAIVLLVIAFHTTAAPHRHHKPRHPRLKPLVNRIVHPSFFQPKFRWRNIKQKHPVESFAALPTGSPTTIPKIQYDFGLEKLDHAVERKRRLKAVEEAFEHSWEGYKKNAWLRDEVSPISGTSKSTFGGWGATLIDTLDTLWIMGMKKDFAAAVASIKRIEFTTADLREINVFETTIRYLGGLLSAYDVSGQKYDILLTKAVELGDMLYHAFDTPNRMPATRWKWEASLLGEGLESRRHSLLAEVGTLSLEFTRLSQLTGDPKWYDAVARLTDKFEASQNRTKIPGLWPVDLNTRDADFTADVTFSIGGMSDSFYEYLPKQHLMLGGQSSQYNQMWLTALPAMKEHIFFRPLNPENRSIIIPGTSRVHLTRPMFKAEGEHLSCFAAGMVALAAKIFHQTHDLETARELLEGCIWAYESQPSSIMPELFSAVPCQEASKEDCGWNETAWHRAVVGTLTKAAVPDDYTEKAETFIKDHQLAPGFTKINDARYILRPEAIESLFVLYRITGDESLRDTAWQMFQAITKATRTPIAFAALKDVRQTGTDRRLLDSMESFWTAETLKYFYLIFSDPNVISLDDYVLNTEAHPLLRPK